MTPKQKVLKRYPKAYAKDGLMSGTWYVYVPLTKEGRYGATKCLGLGLTPKLAWAHASESL